VSHCCDLFLFFSFPVCLSVCHSLSLSLLKIDKKNQTIFHHAYMIHKSVR
jgi:hypothetical protein